MYMTYCIFLVGIVYAKKVAIFSIQLWRMFLIFHVDSSLMLKDFFSLRFEISLVGWNHRYLISRLSLQVLYLWRHVLSTAPPFILWRSNLEILFAPLHRSSPFIGGLRWQAIQKKCSRKNPKSSLYCEMLELPHVMEGAIITILPWQNVLFRFCTIPLDGWNNPALCECVKSYIFCYVSFKISSFFSHLENKIFYLTLEQSPYSW
jgi:hypothetical protein